MNDSRRSFVIAQAVFQGETCAASGQFVMVTVDKQTRKAIELPAEVLARLEPWKLRA